nr:MAG TPA: hypothetical protein [Caudoviricetes sp.]
MPTRNNVLPNDIVPILDRNRRHTRWDMGEIYTGGTKGRGAYVPNVGDLVSDTTDGVLTWYKVVFVDDTTLLSELVMLTDRNESKLHEDLWLGTGPGYTSETWRLFLDTSVVPHLILPDARARFFGDLAHSYKVFKGTDTSDARGVVISMDFNNNGELISDDIPLESVAQTSLANGEKVAVKCCRKGFTTEKLPNGDIVTLVTYNAQGSPSSYSKLLIHNTSLDRKINKATKYVTTISIDSPYLDKTENNTLIFPVNMPRDALALMGVVTYSDGSVKRIPIDGTRMRLAGLEDYVPMRTQNINMTLIYYLEEGELALNASIGKNRFIAVKYFGRTQPVDGSYSVNLVPIPSYVSDAAGYTMRYMLYNLDRDMVYDVTSLVENGSTTAAFDPLNYGSTQQITVALDVDRVDPRMKKYRHVQSFRIALSGRPDPGNIQPWLISFEKDQENLYGRNAVVRAVKDHGLGRWKLDVSAKANNLEEWLERLYYNTKPLVERFTEKRPPTPTHFTLYINGESVTYPVRSWNVVLDFPVGAHDGYGVVIGWIRIDGNNKYYLGCSPMCFMDISEGGVVNHAGSTLIKPDAGSTGNANASTLIDIDAEVKRIRDRGASEPVCDKYRKLLERIKRYGLLRYVEINNLFQRIRTDDLLPAAIANDVILLEMEVNRISIGNFNRDTSSSGHAPTSMEGQSP